VRNHRPKDMEAVREALHNYLLQCRFENCFPNKGYIKALGFSDERQASKSQSGTTSN
jgi:endoglucanase